MISEMAMADLDALKADGITVSPRDICRLNALGVKVEQASKASAFYVLPRVAFLGDIAIHEPTIGDITWIAEAGRRFDMDDIETVALLQATCLSSKDGALPDPTDRDAVMSAIKVFQAKAARFTLSQILSALSYALHGADPTVGEHGPAKDADDAEDERKDDVPPVVAGVIRDGLALRLGTISELMQMRQSQIVAAAEAAIMMQHGPEVFKTARSSAFGEYMRKLEEVRMSAGNGNRPELDPMRPTGNNANQNMDENNGEQNGDAHRDLPPSSGIVAGDGDPHGGSGISHNHAKDFTNG